MKSLLTSSLSTLCAAIHRVASRFPLAIAFLALLTLYTLVLIEHPDENDELAVSVVYYYLGTAALLAVATSLWGQTHRSRRLRYGVNAALQFLCLCNAAYLYNLPALTLGHHVGNCATLVLVAAAIVGVPYWRSRNEWAFRRYCSRLVFASLTAVLTAACLYGGTALLFLSIDELFGYAVPHNLLTMAAAVYFLFCAPLYFLSHLPQPDALEQEQTDVSPLTRFAVRYVLNPLLCVYLLTLYAYAVLILLRWELPNGWVSGLVSTLMAGLVVAVYLYLPLRRSDGWTRDDVVARYGPALMLPLLLLMSIGIGRRLYDYGLTVRRLYLLIFNLWCYAACFYLIFTRARRVKWLLLSPAVVAFVVSVGPWSVTAVTQRVLTREVKTALDGSATAAYPLDATDFRHSLHAMSDETARYVTDKLDYLLDTYGRESIAPFVRPDVDPADFRPDSEDAVRVFSNYFRLDQPADLPGSYNRLVKRGAKCPVLPADLRRDTTRFTLMFTASDGHERQAEFDVPLQRLRTLDKAPSDSAAPVLLSRDGRACLLVETFRLSYRTPPRSGADDTDYLDIEGILLLK